MTAADLPFGSEKARTVYPGMRGVIFGLQDPIHRQLEGVMVGNVHAAQCGRKSVFFVHANDEMSARGIGKRRHIGSELMLRLFRVKEKSLLVINHLLFGYFVID